MRPGSTPPPADSKNWTWVLAHACEECGGDVHDLPAALIAPRLLAASRALVLALQGLQARVRPGPLVWSPLEYACHVRDVCEVFGARLDLILTQEGPRFANWDQDATAVQSRYDEQDPAVVAQELAERAEVLARAYATMPPESWDRPGYRSDGSAFTVLTLGRYLLHDVEHHVYDVTGAQQAH